MGTLIGLLILCLLFFVARRSPNQKGARGSRKIRDLIELNRIKARIRAEQKLIKKQQEELARQAELLIQAAKGIIATDTYNPFDVDLLLMAIDYYHKSYLIVNKDSCLQAIDSLQLEIDRRQEFKSLFQVATKYFYDKYNKLLE